MNHLFPFSFFFLDSFFSLALFFLQQLFPLAFFFLHQLLDAGLFAIDYFFPHFLLFSQFLLQLVFLKHQLLDHAILVEGVLLQCLHLLLQLDTTRPQLPEFFLACLYPFLFRLHVFLGIRKLGSQMLVLGLQLLHLFLNRRFSFRVVRPSFLLRFLQRAYLGGEILQLLLASRLFRQDCVLLLHKLARFRLQGLTLRLGIFEGFLQCLLFELRRFFLFRGSSVIGLISMNKMQYLLVVQINLKFQFSNFSPHSDKFFGFRWKRCRSGLKLRDGQDLPLGMIDSLRGILPSAGLVV